MASMSNYQMKVITGDCGYVLQDVPHLTDYISNLPTYPNPLRSNPAYSVVKQYFVDMDDSVPQKIVVHKDSQRGVHFRRAGPRQRVYFAPEEVHACIVTCGGLCPGLNTVIREIVHSLDYMYGATKVLGIDVYIIGGDGTQKGAAVIYEEIRKRGLKVVVAGIPKTIDNDIPRRPNEPLMLHMLKLRVQKWNWCSETHGSLQWPVSSCWHLLTSFSNFIGISGAGFIAMHATLASRDVDCCLIPESPFYLEGEAEGAGQELLAEKNEQDASGNKLLQDVGLWISQQIKEHFAKRSKSPITLKYIDPTYMIRAIPSNAADNVYCTLLAQVLFMEQWQRITESQNKVVITDRMWARLLSSTNQPSFLGPKEIDEFKKEQGPLTPLLDDARDSGKGTPGSGGVD
ncbi:ATP-dependent 6-phosphofructokinase [Sesamum angolense]|uniref:ATP-dependent 6-phosphofructokinase n=1 Tax=Sesamum angolense TaxID=2727404 RepID=A0AAE2BKJ5_9LAMI|nr:ATP-dependent 6-phosphofructokinase [Sesamum angolense]